MKKISKLLSVILTIIMLFATIPGFAYTISSSEFSDISNYSISTVDYSKNRQNYTKDELLPAEYNYIVNSNCEIEFIAGNTSDEGWKICRDIFADETITGAIKAGHTDVLNMNAVNLWNNRPSSDSGALGILYKKAVTFEGQDIDVFVSFDSWEILDGTKYNASNHMPPFIALGSSSSFGSFMLGQVFNMEYSINFYKPGTFNAANNTGERVNVKGLFSTEDIDNAEINCVKIDSNIEKIYVDINTNLSACNYRMNNENYLAFTDTSRRAVNESTEESRFNRYSVLFSGSSISFSYAIQKEYNTSGWGNSELTYSTVIGESSSTTQYIPHAVNETLTKTITDIDETNVKSSTLNTYNEKFDYNITFVVNNETENRNFYTGGYYIIADNISPLLRINSIKIINEIGEDCTSYFDISNINQSLTFTAQTETLSSANFYGHTYTIFISCNYNGSSVDDIKNCLIENTASLNIYDNVNEYQTTSDTVTTNIPYRTVTINYLEKGTNKKLADSVSEDYLIGSEYDFSVRSVKSIPHYIITDTQGSISGTLTENEVINVYYTLNTASVIVKYVDDTGTDLTGSITINGKVFDSYTTEEKQFENYRLISVPANAAGEMTEDIITVTYIYTLKETGVTANYLDEDGNAIAESENITGKVFDKYNTEQKEIYGYKLIAVPDNASGEMSESPITVNYIYRLKDTSVVVNHMDENGNKLADSETITGTVFDEYTTKEKNIPGYRLIAVPSNASGIMTVDAITVNYVYKKIPASVNVNYLDESGNKLAESILITGNVYEKYETVSKSIPGYLLIAIPDNASGEMTENTITVNYIYRLKDTSVIVNHIDENSNKLTEPEIISGKVFDSYTTAAKEFYGYELKNIPTNVSGIMTEDPITVTYIYRLKNTSVIVKYIDDSGNELTDSITMNGKVFDSYSTEEKQFENYKLISVPANAIGEMTEDVITVTYVYTLKETGVTANYLDEDGKTIADSEYFAGKVLDKYNTEQKEIYGYELIAVPENASGEMKKDTIIVNYIYRIKETTVISNYIDENGNRLSDSETISGKVFDKYNTEQKIIYGYELTAIPENASGEMTEDTITVDYIYKLKTAAVIIRYVDKNGNELTETVTINGKVFDKYISDAETINGYTLTETPENASGTMTENVITVTYVYDKEIVAKPEQKSPNTGNDTTMLEIAALSLFVSLLLLIACSKKKKSRF